MSVSIEDIADKVHALWKVCRHVEVHQHRCRQIHICARDILDRIQDMSDEPGLELIIADANSALKHALQALRQWESISPYQAIVDESKFSSCLEVELRALGECDLHHVLGFEQQWKSAYVRAKERDEDDLVKKLVLLAEESSESNGEETKPKATSPPPVVPTFTVIEKVSLEGQPSSSTNRSHLAITPDAKASDMELKTLEREFYDCVHITSQYQPLLNPLELSPVVAPLAQELSTMTAGQSLGLGDDAAMLRVSHVPFVTISDINKMEDAHYLHNIRDLTLQIRLFSGHPMRRNGSIMTYLGSKIRDKFSADTALEDTSLLQNHSGATLVSVRLCQAHPNDQMLYNMMQRRLLQEACIWSRLTHKNIVPFLGLSRYLKLGKTSILGLVSPWHERTLSDYVKVFPDINHMNLVTGVASGLHYLHSYGLHHGGLHAGAIFISEEGHPQIGCFSLCSKFELNAPLNLVIRLAGQSALRCMAPEYIRGRVLNLNMMLSADVWSLGMVVLQIFTHKTPFEGVPMPHGLVKFLVQGTTPVHPSENTTESLSVSRPQLKRKRSAPLPPMPASNSDALEAAAEAAAEAIPSEEEGHSVIKRGLSDEIWSLLQLCWKYDPSARPTMSEVVKRLKEITETCTIGVKDVTTCVRKTTIYPVANGGQCDIYLGEFVTHPHEKVAMKRLRMFSNSQLEPVRKELMREVRLWCELVHPNILEFYGLYDAGGMSIYMISRWMSNGDAPDYLQKHPDANRRDIVSDSLSGLCYLHSLRILHGDLKGANILIKDDCTACLSDLGLARASHEATATSMRGNGSIRYMSPEILLTNDDSGVSKIPVKTLQSDVFAFGLVIRELLGDEIPYANIQSMPHVIRLIASGRKPSRPDNDVAKEWLCDNMWEIVETTLESDPKARPIISEVSRRVSFVPVIKRFSPRRRISEPNPQKPRLGL